MDKNAKKEMVAWLRTLADEVECDEITYVVVIEGHERGAQANAWGTTKKAKSIVDATIPGIEDAMMAITGGLGLDDG